MRPWDRSSGAGGQHRSGGRHQQPSGRVPWGHGHGRAVGPASGNGIGLVLPLGDNQYQCGELANYQAAYDLSWGRFLNITRPAPGNHEYITGPICRQPGGTMRTMTVEEAAGAGYYQYFGQIHPASRVRIAGRYGVLKIVPDYPSPGRWIHAFKGTDGSTLDRVEMRCH